MSDAYTFTFTIVARYPARLEGNEAHVTVNMAAGRGSHAAYCGTLTMSDGEWQAFVAALERSFEGDVRVEDTTHGRPRSADAAGRAIG